MRGCAVGGTDGISLSIAAVESGLMFVRCMVKMVYFGWGTGWGICKVRYVCDTFFLKLPKLTQIT